MCSYNQVVSLSRNKLHPTRFMTGLVLGTIIHYLCSPSGVGIKGIPRDYGSASGNTRFFFDLSGDLVPRGCCVNMVVARWRQRVKKYKQQT